MRYYAQREHNGDLAVTQQRVNGWDWSYNPDDKRIYIYAKDGEAKTTYKDLKNAMSYMRTHKVE